MKRILLCLVAVFMGGALTACNEQGQRLQIAQSLIQIDSQLPDVPPVNPVVLKKVVFDLPRDTAQKLIRNTPACKARTDVTTPDFIMTCTYYPVIRKSNLFIGLDRKNFQNLNENLNSLIAANQAYEQRIAEVNRQRAITRGDAPATPLGVTVPSTIVNNNPVALTQ